MNKTTKNVSDDALYQLIDDIKAGNVGDYYTTAHPTKRELAELLLACRAKSRAEVKRLKVREAGRVEYERDKAFDSVLEMLDEDISNADLLAKHAHGEGKTDEVMRWGEKLLTLMTVRGKVVVIRGGVE